MAKKYCSIGQQDPGAEDEPSRDPLLLHQARPRGRGGGRVEVEHAPRLDAGQSITLD